MPVLRPTHHCFDDALDLLVALCQANPDDQALQTGLRLVHGICLAPDLGPYSHAWLECDDRCLFRVYVDDAAEPVYVQTTQAEFYAEFRVQECTRYTVAQAWAANHRTGHYGPWEARYRALCRDGTPGGPKEIVHG